MGSSAEVRLAKMDAMLGVLARASRVVTGATTGSTVTGAAMTMGAATATGEASLAAGTAETEARVPKARTANEAILAKENMMRGQVKTTKCESGGSKGQELAGIEPGAGGEETEGEQRAV